MKYRGPLIGLTLFMVVSLTLTWLVYASLRRDVGGKTAPYSAMFTDVYGLREGDDVRMAGVRVGRVEKIDLDGKLAKVSFVVQQEQHVYGNTVASVTYQNIVGQRYLALSLGREGPREQLPSGSVIPSERTEPSFDVTMLLNGFEPLFSVFNPHDADNLAKGVIASLQGDTSSLATLVSQTSTLTETFAGRDQALGGVITNLNKVVGNLAAQNDNLNGVITQTRDWSPNSTDVVRSWCLRWARWHGCWTGFRRRRTDVYPAAREFIDRQPGATRHILSIEPQVAFFGDNVPLALKGLTRDGNQGAYGDGYVCDINVFGFFPGLNDVVPIIVNAATPGNKAWHSPKCRNTADG